MVEAAGIPIPTTSIERSYTAFSTFQQNIAEHVLAKTPAEIAQLVTEQGENSLHNIIHKNSLGQIPLRGERAILATQFLRNYAQREHRIQTWWDEVQGKTVNAVKKDVLRLTNHGEDMQLSDEVLEKIAIQRIHGGIGVIVENAALMQELGIVSAQEIYTADADSSAPLSLSTQKVTETYDLQDALSRQGEIGFVLEDQELSLPEELQELKGMKIAFGTQNAMKHEEAEIFGLYMDEAIDQMRHPHSAFNRLEQKHREPFSPHEDTRLALYDFAARLEEGTEDITLPLLGITPEDAFVHERDAKILAAIMGHVKQKISEARSTFGLGDKQYQGEKIKLAQELRGAVLHPESLLQHWHPDKSLETVLGETPLTNELFVGKRGTSNAFVSERKGRFVYYEMSLHPDPSESQPLREQVNAITINGTQYRIINEAVGGMGRIYVAKDVATGKKIALKEVSDFGMRDWVGYIFAETNTSQGAEELYKFWYQEEKQKDPLHEPNPFHLVRLLRNSTNRKRADYENAIKEAFNNHINGLRIGTPPLPLWDSTSFGINPALHLSEEDPQVQHYYSQIKTALIEGLIEFSKSPFPKEMRVVDRDVFREALTLRMLYGGKGIPKILGWVTGNEGKRKTSRYYNHHYLAMEFIEGPSLKKALEDPVSFDKAIEYADQLMQILGYVHSYGIIYRDLKPGNVIVSPSGQLYLIDYGTGVFQPHTPAEGILTPSKLPSSVAGPSLKTDNYEARLGTPVHAAPEQYSKDITSLTPTADVYGMGVVLLQMLATDFDPESHPFPDDLTIQLTLGRKGVPRSVIDVVTKAMQLNPLDRFQSADAMRLALAQAVGGKTIPLPTPPPTGKNTVNLPPPVATAPTVRLHITRGDIERLIRPVDQHYPVAVRSVKAIPPEVARVLTAIRSLPTTPEMLEALEIFGDKDTWKVSHELRDLAPFLAAQHARGTIAEALRRGDTPQPEWYAIWGKLLSTTLNKQPANVDIPQRIKNDEVQAFFNAATEAVDKNPTIVNDMVTQLRPLFKIQWFTDFPEHKRGLTLSLTRMIYTALSKGESPNEATLTTLEAAMTTNKYLGVTSAYALPSDVKSYFEIVKQLAAQNGHYPWLKSHLRRVLDSTKDWHLYKYIELPLEQLISSM